MRKTLALLAALPCFVAGAAAAADMAYQPAPAARAVTVTRTATATTCPPLPALTRHGRHGIGEPGSFYGYWDWRYFPTCDVVIGR